MLSEEKKEIENKEVTKMTRASTNMDRSQTRTGSLVEQNLRDLRQDCNILAQHLSAIRKDMQEKISTLANTSNKFEFVTSEVLEEVTQKLKKGEVDMYSQALSQIIKEDNAASRKQLFEDIERAIAAQEKSSSRGSSMIHWVVDMVLFIGLIVVLFIQMKGLK